MLLMRRIICETYRNVIERVRIDLNDLKNGDFDISDKEHSGHPATVKNELRKDGKKSKTMENILINLYCIDFFYCNKKSTRTFAPI